MQKKFILALLVVFLVGGFFIFTRQDNDAVSSEETTVRPEQLANEVYVITEASCCGLIDKEKASEILLQITAGAPYDFTFDTRIKDLFKEGGQYFAVPPNYPLRYEDLIFGAKEVTGESGGKEFTAQKIFGYHKNSTGEVDFLYSGGYYGDSW